MDVLFLCYPVGKPKNCMHVLMVDNSKRIDFIRPPSRHHAAEYALLHATSREDAPFSVACTLLHATSRETSVLYCSWFAGVHIVKLRGMVVALKTTQYLL